MSLSIYSEPDPSSAFSSNESFSDPLQISLNGTLGGSIQKKFYIRNNDAAHYFTDITVTSNANGETDLISGANGFSWKLIAGDLKPLDAQWDIINGGNTISLSDLGSSGTPDTSTYLPFWLKVEIPRNVPVSSYQNISLDINATKTAV